MAEPPRRVSGRPPSSSTRRRFLAWLSGALGAVLAAVLGAPLVESVAFPGTRQGRRRWSRAGSSSVVRADTPTRIDFMDKVQDAYLESTQQRHAWAVLRASGAIVVYSPICTHLGCRYHWDDATRHFECPCHGSVFALDGQVLAGPAPRPLDTLPSKVENGTLYVEWELFEPGIPKKVEI